ncbi:ANTAR domain-containing protein [Mycobacterium talmoniae]|uniref:ANTAR domain-containing protein n=1 Tax=Mycobacterium talmoniae TaxID=1858794 RepID=A0A1S1NLC5_9MYCO|nr:MULTISPECIES: ANTAR domain-containing protein [Mycobacterium]OHV04000.1 hypothetical protein BKN37_12060 [Mycobacterium talmoniae]PQM45600.1 hypothetical protein C1Y40_04247 [Mycobacterium talmoniae]TDH49616.1 ANTAR domain-containing protein [Mycobacterium eburneum]
MGSDPTSGPHHDGGRILDAAEGVLVALRRCTLAEAFNELARTAREHRLPALSLARALVAVAENQPRQELNLDAVEVVRNVWGNLLDRLRDRRDGAGPMAHQRP